MGMSAFTTLVQHSAGNPRHSNQTRRRNKRHPKWKERSKTVFADDMILYRENPKDSTKKTTRTDEFGKVAGYKFSIQK